MKELSIQEKAQAYDEAIKKVNDYYEGKTKLYSDVDKTLDYLFPELKESEDEKIRKEIIDCFKTMKQQGCFPLKHKEQYKSWIAWLEKQGEQKVADKIEPIEWSGKIKTRKVKGVLKEMLDEKLKSSWSEEDDRNLSIAIQYVFQHGYLSTVNWLKALKCRYTWKPSDLQIEALESATANCAYSEYEDCLTDLIKELKKNDVI